MFQIWSNAPPPRPLLMTWQFQIRACLRHISRGKYLLMLDNSAVNQFMKYCTCGRGGSSIAKRLFWAWNHQCLHITFIQYWFFFTCWLDAVIALTDNLHFCEREYRNTGNVTLVTISWVNKTLYFYNSEKCALPKNNIGLMVAKMDPSISGY